MNTITYDKMREYMVDVMGYDVTEAEQFNDAEVLEIVEPKMFDLIKFAEAQ